MYRGGIRRAAVVLGWEVYEGVVLGGAVLEVAVLGGALLGRDGM